MREYYRGYSFRDVKIIMKKYNRLNRILFLIFILLFLAPGLYLTDQTLEQEAHYLPDYQMLSLRPTLNKPFLTAEDYRLLFRQTGLAPCAVNNILQQAGSPEAAYQKFSGIQKRFFAPVSVSCTFNTPISKEEHIPPPMNQEAVFAPYQNADILITFASHTVFWRNGHAALIVDASGRQTLEAAVLGSNSSYQSVAKWSRYPAFVLLRLKNITPELADAIAAAAKERLYNIPYHLTAGIFSDSYPIEGPLKGTQCAHLVYTAYYLNGYNLDSDGGAIVTPLDLLESDYLEIIQIYGYSPKLFEDRLFP